MIDNRLHLSNMQLIFMDNLQYFLVAVTYNYHFSLGSSFFFWKTKAML